MRRTWFFVAACGVTLATTPPVAAYNLYFGNLHSHCALSDGTGTPEDAFTHARDVAGIDVLALTDHTHLLTASEYTSLLGIADSFTQNGVFVALGAQEFGNLNDFGHINIFDSAYRNPNVTENLIGTYTFILSQNAFGSFNHANPEYGTNFDNLAFYPQYADAIRALEVVNGRFSGNYEAQYIQALNNGWKLGPFANQDNHQGLWGDQPNPNAGGDIYLTGILADGLTRADILAALRARRFFATEVDPPNDRMELLFTIDGYPMGSELTTGVAPSIQASARSLNGTSLWNRIELFRDGVLVNTQIQIGTEIGYAYTDFLSDGESHYYFVRGHQVDGNYAWSAPIWVTAHLEPAGAGEAGQRDRAALLPSSPNPSGGRTDIRFVLPGRSAPGPYRVHLTIHDTTGRVVRDLGERLLSAGQHSWTWDGRGDRRADLPAGVYLYELRGLDLPDGAGGLGGRIVLLR